MLKLVCKHCECSFEGNDEKFCSQVCENTFIVSMEKRIREAIKDDPGHTAKMSKDY